MEEMTNGDVILPWLSRGIEIQYEIIYNCNHELRFKNNNRNNRCELCDEDCTNCPTISNCIINFTTYYQLYDKIKCCMKQCPIEYENTPVNGQCLKRLICDISCKTCISSPTNCTECNTISKYYPLVDAANKCVLDTLSPDGYYFNSTNSKHEKCDISCKLCDTTPTKCKECNNVGGYYYKDNLTETCFIGVPLGYILDATLKKYIPCDISCAICIDFKTKCTLCNTNYFPLEDNLTSCYLSTDKINGYFYDTISKTFKKCGITCQSCTDNASKCLVCNYNYFKLIDQINTCVSTCPDKYWKNITLGICSSCKLVAKIA